MPVKKEQYSNEKNNKKILQSFSLSSHIGFIIAACIFISVFIGKFLDDIFGTSPGLLLFFSLLGVAAAFVAMYRLAKISIRNISQTNYKNLEPEENSES